MFTPNHARKHMGSAGLESFTFSVSYFSCGAIYSCKCGFEARSVPRPIPTHTRAPGCPPAGPLRQKQPGDIVHTLAEGEMF